MTKTQEVKVCDVCGKEVVAQNEGYYGGHPFHGWLEVKSINGSTALEELNKPRQWDVCGKACLQLLSKRV